jgi:hypothetical protein
MSCPIILKEVKKEPLVEVLKSHLPVLVASA